MSCGARLVRAWTQQGITSRKEFWRLLRKNGYGISYSHLGRITRDEVDPSIYDINAICDTVPSGMSADYWLRGRTRFNISS